MNCFSCFGSQKSRKSHSRKEHGSTNGELTESRSPETKKQKPGDDNQTCPTNQGESGNNASKTFTFRELATATRNFRQECLLGEGGFGRVFKGTLASNGQVVAVKQLDRSGMQGNKEFLVEVLMLSLLQHPNLVHLIGYCADGDQRLLVYEFMSGGSLEDRLLDISKEQKTLDWFTRIRIAFGAAKGLEYLHDKANPPVIYRDLKPSNILLDEELTPKLSDYGLAKLGPSNDNSMHVPSVMGTYGYCAPEYSRGGQLTIKSDVYSFGVVLLELITGRRALDTTRPNDEQNLVAWATPLFRDPKRFPDMADPLLKRQFPEKDLNQAVAMAAMCLQEEPAARPLMSDVVTALSFLSLSKEDAPPFPQPPSTPALEENGISGNDHNRSVSSSYRSSKVVQDASSSSSDGSSRGSHHRKSSKKSSRRGSSQVSRNETEYLSYKSMGRSQNGSSSSDEDDGDSDGGSEHGSAH